MRAAIDRWIFEEYRPGAPGLPLYRVLFAGYVLLLAVPRHGWIAGFPDAFFRPPLGPTLLFGGFPPAWFFHGLDFGLLLAGLCLPAGYRPRIASLAIALLLLSGNAWAYSFGKINHDLLPIVAAGVLAFSGWEGPLVERPPRERPARERPAWPLALLAMLVAMAMYTAAHAKLRSGWLDPGAQASLGHLLHNHFVTERQTALSTLLLRVDNPLFWKLSDYATVALEAGFLLAMLRRRALLFWCALASWFHLGVLLSLGIPFHTNLLVYGAFVDWSALTRRRAGARLAERFDALAARVGPSHLLAGAALIFVFYRLVGDVLHPPLIWGMHLTAAAIALAAGARGFTGGLNRRTTVRS